jgi:hypothetical protein
MTATQRAWAAGLFEGEGTVGAYWNPRKWTRADGTVTLTRQCRIAASVVMTDDEPLRSFFAIVGVGNVTGPYVRGARPKERPFYCWRVTNSTGVRKVFRLIGPYLSSRRRAQFENSITTVSDAEAKSLRARQRRH